MSPQFAYIENPNNGHDVRVYYSEIEDLALEDGITTSAEDMDDGTFYFYAEMAIRLDRT